MNFARVSRLSARATWTGLAGSVLVLAWGCGPSLALGPAASSPPGAPSIAGSGAGAASPSPALPVPPAGPSPVAPGASPAATPLAIDPARRPIGPPEGDRPAYGALQGVWQAGGESISLYGTREPAFAGKAAGTTTSYYLQVADKVYGIHWDDLERFQTLKVGQTVNLHPADMVACKVDATHPAGLRCWRLYHVYPGSRRQGPLTGG